MSLLQITSSDISAMLNRRPPSTATTNILKFVDDSFPYKTALKMTMMVVVVEVMVFVVMKQRIHVDIMTNSVLLRK